MILTLLSKSNRTLVESLKIIKYPMQGTRSNFFSFFLLINVKVVKRATSFWLLKAFVGIVTFLLVDIVLDAAQIFDLIFVIVFFCNLSGVDRSSWIASLAVFLMTFVFLEGLSQSLRLTYISKRKIIGLSFVFISIGLLLIFFNSWSVIF